MTDLSKTRFAPSPTGLLHLGNVRTALFNALLAHRDQGVFLLRIEDTDAERSRAEHTVALQADLRWLGLDWQEGPDAGGDNGPYAQSARGEIYARHAESLVARDLSYPCFCSALELEMSRKAQRAVGRPPRYAGTCAQLSADERAARLAEGRAHTWRFRVPAGRVIEFEDLVRGPQRFASDDIGDFVLRRADGSAAFFFSNAVDDGMMGVSHVLRGEDHLANTPRQILLLEALGLPVPRYGHISLIVGADGAPLSKRSGSRSVAELRESGFLPLAVINYLARLGHHYSDEGFHTFDGLAASFDTAHLGRAPARYDEAQLLHWQAQAIAAASADDLWNWVGQGVRRLVPDAARDDFIALIRGNIRYPADALHWAEILYADAPPSAEARAELARTDAGFFAQARDALSETGAEYARFIEAVKVRTGAKGKALFMPLRAALTGELHGPELAGIMAAMTVERLGQRLETAGDMAANECK